jgi:hypothetical protein
VRQELIDHADVDVAFEQRFADPRERFVHVLLRELSLATQVFEDSLQLVCQVLKHQGLSLLSNSHSLQKTNLYSSRIDEELLCDAGFPARA